MKRNDRNMRKSLDFDKKKPEEAKKASVSLVGKEEVANINAGDPQGVDFYFDAACADDFTEEKEKGFKEEFEAWVENGTFYDADDYDDIDGGRF